MSLSLILNSTNTTAETTLSALTTKPDSIVSVSALIAEQLPSFVRQDHTRLTEFMEAYYEWMEQKSGTVYSTAVLQDYSDIDTSISDFISHFRNQYLENFPVRLAYDQKTKSAVDEKRLLKRIKEFYRAKGTEKAYKLLFRILHDTEIVQFYYPQTDIVKSSSGVWITDKSLKVSFTNPEIWNIKDKTITQTESGQFIGSGIVRDIKQYNTSNASVAELFIDEINGEFRTDRITIEVGGNTASFTESVFPVVTGIEPTITKGPTGATQSGLYYAVGEKISVLTGTGGQGAIAEVSRINGQGGILSVKVVDSGIGYLPTDTLTFQIDTVSGTGAGLTASFGAVTNYPGYYFGSAGQASANKKLFDNRFYQDFSYEIKTSIALQTYKKEVLNLIHPAGTKLFNQMLMKNIHNVENRWKTSARPFEISVLGHYTPYTFNTTENLRHNSNNIDCYPFGYNPTNALANEGATLSNQDGHTGYGARTSQWFGQVYNDWAGRTAQSDSVVAGMTFAFTLGSSGEAGSISGGTWAAGSTTQSCSGPMFEGSQGVFLITHIGTAGASAAYAFVGTADAGTFDEGGSYWVIYPHPNIRGITGSTAGCKFSEVEMNGFFYIDVSGPTGAGGGIVTKENSFTMQPNRVSPYIGF